MRQRAAIRAAIVDVQQTVRDVVTTEARWGVLPGALQRMDAGQRFALAETVQRSSKLGQIAALLGRFKRRLGATPRPTDFVQRGAPVGVERGRDLERLLPGEVAQLADDDLRHLALLRWLRGEANQYRVRGRRPIGLGPIIACHDESGSMKGMSEVWSKAITLALFGLAREQQRPFAAIAFGSAGELRTVRIERPAWVTLAQLIEIAEPFFDGGTSFEGPLTEAMGLISMPRSAFRKADIVFITDGEADVTPAFTEAFQQFKRTWHTEVHTVLIGMDADDTGVRQWSDRISLVPNLADSSAESILINVARGVAGVA